MNIEQYKEADRGIRNDPLKTRAYNSYVQLMQIFVQDCWLTGVEPYYANKVKEKSNVLFELQEYFDK